MTAPIKKRESKEYKAFAAHRRSSDRLAIAQRRIENFTDHLFNALKDKEKALIEYHKTARALHKARGFTS